MMMPRTPAHAPLRLLPALVLALALLGSAAAQSTPQRVLVVPLQGPPELASWSIGLATGLQRALNVVDGVFVPPIGDPVVLADRAVDAGLEPVEVLIEHFAASSVLGGRIASAPDGFDLTLERYGAGGLEGSRTITIPADPAAAFPQVAELAVELLALTPSTGDLAALAAVASEAPSSEALQPVAVAAARLPGTDSASLRAAVELSPTSSWALAELARVLSIEGQHDEAVATAIAATEARDEDVEAWTVRGVVHLRAEDATAAEAAFRAALERNPSHAVARAGLAGLLPSDDAEREYRRAIDAYPRLLDAHLALAEAAQGPRAFQLLRAAGESLPEAVRLHSEIVDRALAANDPAGALSYLRSTAERPLARTPGLFALAEEVAAARADDALAFVREGREAFPDAPELALAEASLLLDSGDAAAAEATLRPFAEATPDDPRIANRLALALVAQERTDEARALLAGAAEGDATVRFNLAQALLEAGLPRDAADELAGDMGAEQVDPEAWAVYGTALAGAGRGDEARSAYERALELEPGQDLAQRGLRRLDERERVEGSDPAPLPPEAQAAFERGLTLLEGGRFAEAADAFREALDAAPDRPVISFYLGTALQRDGQVRAALEAYEPALEAFGDSGTVLNNVGFAQLQIGRFDLALPRLRDAVAAAPDNARAHLNLGLTYFALQRYRDAVEAFDRAIELDPALEPSVREARERAQGQATGAAE